MPEFLLELYSEEIPPQLQINARNQLKEQLEKSLEEEGIQHKDCLEYSSPTRLSIYIKSLPEKIKIKANCFIYFLYFFSTLPSSYRYNKKFDSVLKEKSLPKMSTTLIKFFLF